MGKRLNPLFLIKISDSNTPFFKNLVRNILNTKYPIFSGLFSPEIVDTKGSLLIAASRRFMSYGLGNKPSSSWF